MVEIYSNTDSGVTSSFSTMSYLSLGYWTGEKSCLLYRKPYILTSYICWCLWKPPEALPENVQEISIYLPTRHYAELVWAVLLERDIELKYIGYLAISFVLFGIIAVIGYRRDQSRRFS